MKLTALGIEAYTGLAPKACRRMSVKPGPQGNALINIDNVILEMKF